MKKIALSLLLTTFISTVSFAADPVVAPATQPLAAPAAAQVASDKQEVNLLDITDAKIVVTGQNAAVYFTAKAKDQAVKIVAVELEDKTIAEKVELHKIEKDDKGVHKMIKADNIIINAGEEFHFKAGGHHVMVMGLKKGMRNDDMVKLVILSEALATQTFEAKAVINAAK